MKRELVAAVSLVMALAATSARATETQLWVSDSPADYSKSQTSGVLVGPDGVLQLGPRASSSATDSLDVIWAIAPLPGGAVALAGDEGRIDRLWRQVQGAFEHIDRDEGVVTTCTDLDTVSPALAAPVVQNAIRDAARSLHLASIELPSAAVQDAQQIARIAPMGMIFVPSVNGISHSPKELTRWSDCANGANVLLQTILRMDRL